MSTPRLDRRAMLAAAGSGFLATLTRAESAYATLVRGLTLDELANQSARILVLEPHDARSHWESIAGRRMIVTDTAVRVLDSLRDDAGVENSLLLRTLGGRVGATRELVHGQPDFGVRGHSVAFLTLAEGGLYWATGMAQGHYPLSAEAQVLSASQFLPKILKWRSSAVRALHGQRLSAARRMIAQAGSR